MGKTNNELSEEKGIYKDYFDNTLSRKNFLRYSWIKQKFLGNINSKKILEVGCGDGGVIELLKNENSVVGIDISSNGVKNLKSLGIKSYLVDISQEKIPAETGFFDFVLVFEVFEHLKSPQYAIEEIQRVCRKNGIVLLSIPNYRTGHKFIYRGLFYFKSFEKYLIDNGFEIVDKKQYGICPPLWNIWGESFLHKQNKTETVKNRIPFTARINRYLSSDFFRCIVPTKFSWLLIFELRNRDPDGAKKLYDSIADETKNAYR